MLLSFSSLDQYFQIVSYYVIQACRHFETYTIQFPSLSGFQRILSLPCLITDAEAIPSFVLLFPLFVPLD